MESQIVKSQIAESHHNDFRKRRNKYSLMERNIFVRSVATQKAYVDVTE